MQSILAPLLAMTGTEHSTLHSTVPAAAALLYTGLSVMQHVRAIFAITRSFHNTDAVILPFSARPTILFWDAVFNHFVPGQRKHSEPISHQLSAVASASIAMARPAMPFVDNLREV